MFDLDLIVKALREELAVTLAYPRELHVSDLFSLLQRVLDRIERPAQAEGAGQKNGFQDKNGNWVYPGDRVVSTLDSWRGVLREALQDGDAEVMFDGGHPRQVKWNHLLKITDGCPRCGAKRAVGDACHVLGCPMAAPKPTDAPAPTQPIEAMAKADALIKQAQAVQLELLNLAARYDVGTRPRGTIINASDTLTELVVAIRAALAVQPSPAPTQGLADDAPPMLKALIHALHEYELAGEHEVPSPVEAFRVALARRGFIVRAVSEPSPGPSIADLKPGTYGLFIDRDGGGCIYADDGPGCQSRRIKSWPATDGGMG